MVAGDADGGGQQAAWGHLVTSVLRLLACEGTELAFQDCLEYATKGQHISKLEDPVHSRSDASSGGAHTACRATVALFRRYPSLTLRQKLAVTTWFVTSQIAAASQKRACTQLHAGSTLLLLNAPKLSVPMFQKC